MEKEKIDNKIRLLEELGVHLTPQDYKKLLACKNEIQLDNVAHSLFMR